MIDSLFQRLSHTAVVSDAEWMFLGAEADLPQARLDPVVPALYESRQLGIVQIYMPEVHSQCC